MKTQILFRIVIISAFFGTMKAQENPRKLFNLELGVNRHHFKMDELNNRFVQRAIDSDTMLLTQHLTRGFQLQARTSFRVHRLFDVGFSLGYQNGKTEHNPTANIHVDNVPDVFPFVWIYDSIEGIYGVNAHGFTIGLSSSFYFSELLNFSQKENWFNRLGLALDFQVGYAFSRVSVYNGWPGSMYQHANYNREYDSQSLVGQLGFKAEYDLLRSDLLAAIGVRGGYQFYKTGSVKTITDIEWRVDGEPMRLDFSGVYFGVYLKLAR
jgi:hypothetical protein